MSASGRGEQRGQGPGDSGFGGAQARRRHCSALVPCMGWVTSGRLLPPLLHHLERCKRAREINRRVPNHRSKQKDRRQCQQLAPAGCVRMLGSQALPDIHVTKGVTLCAGNAKAACGVPVTDDFEVSDFKASSKSLRRAWLIILVRSPMTRAHSLRSLRKPTETTLQRPGPV